MNCSHGIKGMEPTINNPQDWTILMLLSHSCNTPAYIRNI